jgi:uncharacterized protein (DUF2164 family)
MEPLRKEEREDAVRRIQHYFREERGEEVGDLAAGILLQAIERDIAPAFYNRGVRDAKAQALRSFAALAEDLESLERLPPKARAKA